jgi:nucleoside-diphosphate-sugar epimerase
VTLVTGATGLIGGEVVLALAKARRRVRAVVRAESHAHARHRVQRRLQLSQGYESRYADFVEAVAGDCQLDAFGSNGAGHSGVATIIHCAANTSFSERERDDIWATNVGGATNLIALARAAAPDARIVFVSTASVVTAPTGECLPEDAAFAGYENAYTESKREAERLLATSGLDVIILRPSIVLSRGVDDRRMARSILWALPIMKELGDVPVDPDAYVDVVPADFVADVVLRLATAPHLAHRLYHVSAGRDARTMHEILNAIAQTMPEYGDIRLIGAGARHRRRSAMLFAPLKSYLPFINASVRYSADRLIEAVGPHGRAPVSMSYIPELLGLISLDEAFAEMAKP